MPSNPSFRECWCVPVLVACGTLVGVGWAIDPATNGPGVTIDEPFNVQHGVRLAVLVPEFVRGGVTLVETFGEAGDPGTDPDLGHHFPDHPPFARMWLGVTHRIVDGLVRTGDDPTFVVSGARWGSAIAFALTVLLVGRVASGWYGWRAGAVACAAVVLMPRSWGHAHIASIETVLSLVWAGTLLAVAGTWDRGDDETGRPLPVPDRTAAWSGGLLGLLLLTKIHAVLLPIPVAFWALLRWRTAAVRPLAIWGGVGFAVFFVGWPWLWLDPVGHLAEFFGRATDRSVIFVEYLGTKFADRAVPWHYPLVMLAVTVPVGWLALGAMGITARPSTTDPPRESGETTAERPRATSGETLILLASVFPLLVFAVPGVTVYDGVRLFLVVLAPGALLVARGATIVLDRLDRRWGSRPSTIAVALFATAQGWAVVAMCPCHLASYNLLVGGPAGARALGLETTYWGDSITGELVEHLSDLPRGTTVHMVPVLHPAHPMWIAQQSDTLRRGGIHLAEWSPDDAPQATRWLLVFHRNAYWPDGLRDRLTDATLRAEVRRMGVRLASIHELVPDE